MTKSAPPSPSSSGSTQQWLGHLESLADLTRLRLLGLLERHELGVAELCDVLQLPQSTVSRHLKLLSDQGWTVSRRQGANNLYRMLLDELDESGRKLWLLARQQLADLPTAKQDQLRLTRLLRDRHKHTQSFFKGAAASWDRLRRELYGAHYTTAALLGLLPGHWVVADLGCGSGAITAELAEHVGRVIGVDQSEAMLKAAARNTLGLSNVELRRGHLEALPLDDGQCDAALLVIVLTYMADPARALGEMARILKPGGRAVVVDMLRHDREDFARQMGQQWLGFEAGELETMLRAAGFERASCRPLPPETGVKGPALLLAKADKSAPSRPEGRGS